MESFKEKIGEEIYNQKVRNYEAMLKLAAEEQEKEQVLFGSQLINSTYTKAMEELGLEG